MANVLDQHIEFVIPDPFAVSFVPTYSKYETAAMNKKTIENKRGVFLSRIPKKNGKHRYYLSQRVVTDSHCNGCGEANCRSDYCGSNIYEYGFVSKYVGKDLHSALLELFAETTK